MHGAPQSPCTLGLCMQVLRDDKRPTWRHGSSTRDRDEVVATIGPGDQEPGKIRSIWERNKNTCVLLLMHRTVRACASRETGPSSGSTCRATSSISHAVKKRSDRMIKQNVTCIYESGRICI